jgi:outer membrane protein assembly factor BamB
VGRTGEPGTATAGSRVVVSGGMAVAGDYNLVAFDLRTGDERWRFAPAVGYGPGIYLGDPTPETVLAGSPAGRLYAIASATGDVRWSGVIAADNVTTVFAPASDGGVVAAAYTTFRAPNTGGVVLFDLLTGRERWRAAFPRSADRWLGTGSAGGPLLISEFVVAAAGNGVIYAFDRDDGAIRWTLPALNGLPPVLRGPFPPPAEIAGADFRPLAAFGSTLIAGSLKGVVVAYDVHSRRELWRYDGSWTGSVGFGLHADRRSVYVPFVSGRHVALDLETGLERWRTAGTSGGFSWTAASDGQRVYLAGGNGGYVAIAR